MPVFKSTPTCRSVRGEVAARTVVRARSSALDPRARIAVPAPPKRGDGIPPRGRSMVRGRRRATESQRPLGARGTRSTECVLKCLLNLRAPRTSRATTTCSRRAATDVCTVA